MFAKDFLPGEITESQVGGIFYSYHRVGVIFAGGSSPSLGDQRQSCVLESQVGGEMPVLYRAQAHRPFCHGR